MKRLLYILFYMIGNLIFFICVGIALLHLSIFDRIFIALVFWAAGCLYGLVTGILFMKGERDD